MWFCFALRYTTSRDESIGPRDHAGLWLKYKQGDVDRDLDNARRLHLNQVRVFGVPIDCRQ